jgi:hypothetical protein
MNITPNFSYQEFSPFGSSPSWMPPFTLQDQMIRILAAELQVIRLYWNKPLTITCGVRTAADYSRLLSNGFHPSILSDHYCGNVISIPITDNNYKIFGPYYAFSCGAADISSDDPLSLFQLGIKLNQSGAVNFGQIIHEMDVTSGKNWVHFGNDRTKFFTSTICNMLSKDKYLYSTDGGITYIPYSI